MTDTLSHKRVQTRKVHKCWGCCAEIPKGANVWVTVSVDAGSIGRAYWCDICDQIAGDYDPWGDGYFEGELTEQAEEVRLLLVDALNSVMRQAIQK